jgi:hypothetical protein
LRQRRFPRVGISARHGWRCTTADGLPGGSDLRAIVERVTIRLRIRSGHGHSGAGREQIKQSIRLRRFCSPRVLGALPRRPVGVLHAGSDRSALAARGYAIVAAFIVAFFCIFRFGINLRFADASLTAWQFLASVFTMLYVVYRAPETRLVFTAFFFVALMFCMLRHSGRSLIALSAVSLLAFRARDLASLRGGLRRGSHALGRAAFRSAARDDAVVRIHRRVREAAATRAHRGEPQAGRHRGERAP